MHFAKATTSEKVLDKKIKLSSSSSSSPPPPSSASSASFPSFDDDDAPDEQQRQHQRRGEEEEEEEEEEEDRKKRTNVVLSIVLLLLCTTLFATFFHGHKRVGEAFDESVRERNDVGATRTRREKSSDVSDDNSDTSAAKESVLSSSKSSFKEKDIVMEQQRENRHTLDKEAEREQKRPSSPPAPIVGSSSSSSSSSSRRRSRRGGQQQAEFTLEHVGPKGTSEVRPNGRCVSSGGNEKERKIWQRLETLDDPLFIRVTGAYYDPKRTRNKPKTRSLIMHRSMFEPSVRVVRIDRNGERVEPGSRSGGEDSEDGTDHNPLLTNERSEAGLQDEKTRPVESEDEEIILDFREADLIEQLPREDEDHNEFSFGTCAIVGNSGAILGKRYGTEIDEKDAVWRVNYAPIDGFEKDVGYRTTFDLINQQHTKRFVRGDGEYSEEDEDVENNDASGQAEEIDEADESKPKVFLKNGRGAKHASKRNSTLMVFEVTSNYARKHLYARLMRQRTNKGLKIWSPELVVHAQRSWDILSRLTAQKMGTSKTGKAMSGAYAVLLASQICEEVHLYGFSPYKRRDIGQTVPYHYFDEIPAVLKHHSFDLAIEVFKTIRDWPCSGVRLEIHP